MAVKNLTRGVSRRNTVTYDFAVHGGATTDTYPGFTLPLGAKLIASKVKVTKTLTSGGSATVAIALTGATIGTDVTIKTATAYNNSFYTTGVVNTVDLSSDTNVILAEIKTLNIAIAGAALTAGKIVVTVSYFI